MKIKFISLASGSSGNCYFLGTDRYGILVDAGIGIRTIKKTLKELGIGLDIIRAVFITHDHADHIKAVGHLGEKFGIPVYSTPEVHAGINKSYCMTEKLSTCVHYLHKGETMELEDFTITAFEVPHDGTDNVGYCMNIDGKIFSFLTDLGHITPTAAEYICKANYLVLEANYDEEMLKMGPYPQYLKERIAGPNGHMSNRETADFLAENINESLKYIWLCHLSKDNNHPELEKLDSLMRPLTEGNLANISSISICGYASPDGIYKDNEILASNRARCFKEYMRATYAPGYDLYKVSSVPEDWDGLVELLQRHPMNHGDEVLSLIARTGIFEGREKQLMDMHGGTVYRELLKSYFPQLRRIRITVGYEARAFNIEEAASLIYTHPRLLSLQEMYRVAAFYRPGTEQYREIYEIAAYHFPDDVLANINAASAVIMAGDPVSARQYLNKVADDPRAWNDFGVLAYLEGDRKKAEKWFRKALGIEPEKARKNLKKMKYEE